MLCCYYVFVLMWIMFPSCQSSFRPYEWIVHRHIARAGIPSGGHKSCAADEWAIPRACDVGEKAIPLLVCLFVWCLRGVRIIRFQATGLHRILSRPSSICIGCTTNRAVPFRTPFGTSCFRRAHAGRTRAAQWAARLTVAATTMTTTATLKRPILH